MARGARSVTSVLSRNGPASEVRDIQVRLTALQGRAAEFEADMRVVDDPGSEQAYVDQNNELVSSVNAAMADFDDAQRRCATAINALYSGGITLRADDEDGVAEVDEFWDATEVPFTSPGHLGAGQKYTWKIRTTGTDPATGKPVIQEKTVRYHAQGPDPTRPPTDNAGAGPTHRVRVGNHYVDAHGNRYTANSVKPGSAAFDPQAANDTHIPFPTDQPPPHIPHARVFVPNPAGVLGPDGPDG